MSSSRHRTGRYHACDLCAAELHRKAGGAGAEPRVNLTRFNGVFAPNSKHQALVTPAKRGKGNKPKAADDMQERTPAECRASMSWAQRLIRIFRIDIETCSDYGGAMKDIACIEYPVVIKQMPSLGP